MIFYQHGELHEGGFKQDIAAPGFRFGAGFFETLLYNGKEVRLLDAHLKRLSNSLRSYDFVLQETDFSGAISQVLAANTLSGGVARVNIFCHLEAEEQVVAPIIVAAPYVHPADKTYSLTFASTPVQHPLMAHKTMNYMMHWLEMRQAKKAGYDDAVLTQHGNILLETTTAALIFSDGHGFCMPSGADKLPSTALAVAKELLPISSCTIRAQQAKNFNHAYVLNSLIGMRPVHALNGHTYEVNAKPCAPVTLAVCGELP